MTKITFFKSKGKCTGFECFGHADYADEGEDIVCAAISVLTINTMNSIEAFTEDKIDVKTLQETGFMSMHFENPDDLSKEALVLMRSLELGLNSIASEYGKQFVTVLTQEV